MSKSGYTYILTNKTRTVFYIGVTSDIKNRILRHKVGKASAFTTRYNSKMLVHYEEFPDMNQAIQREKQLKRWKRDWKIDLVREKNPNFQDIADGWYSQEELDAAAIHLLSN